MGEEFNGVLYVGGEEFTNGSLEYVSSFSVEINGDYPIKEFRDIKVSVSYDPNWLGDTLYPGDKYDVEYLVPEQVRKHKKKRINKKWRKRYGYTYKLKKTKGWEVEFDSNGTIRFVKNLGGTK